MIFLDVHTDASLMHVCARVDYVPPPPGSRRKRGGEGKESNPVATSCVRDCNFTPTQLSRPSSRRWSIDRPSDRALPYPLLSAVALPPRVATLPFCPSFTLVREVSFFFLPPGLSLALSVPRRCRRRVSFSRPINRGLLLSCQCYVEHGASR